MSKSANILFDDMFTITNVDGNKYERGRHHLSCFLVPPPAMYPRVLNQLCTDLSCPILKMTRNVSYSTLWSIVSRLQAKSTNFGMDLSLDFNHELYPLRQGETVTLVLASSLQLGAVSRTGDDDKMDRETWRPHTGPSKGLDADYDYVMYGKIYKFDEGAGERVYASRFLSSRRWKALIELCRTAYVSYGGLLMALSGSYRHMSGIVLGEYVYLLMRKR